MPNSFTYDDIDLSIYGLIVKSKDISIRHAADAVQLKDKSYAGDSKILPKSISLSIAIIGTNVNDLVSKMDNIKAVLNKQADKKLVLDSLNDRYWNARLNSLSGNSMVELFEGTIDFICHDPWAFSIDLVSNDHIIISNLQSVSDITGGTARVRPVYTLTANADLGVVTIGVKNMETEMEIEWAGELLNTDKLEIDCTKWRVSKNEVVSMATVSGQFPYLAPGNNFIEISGFLGTLNIKYHKRYV